MYQRHTNSWLKHLDFIVIDVLCLQVAFVLAFWLTVKLGNPYYERFYQYQLAVLTLSQIVIIMFTDAYGGILRRGAFTEAVAVFKEMAFILILAVIYLFVVHQSVNVSRLLFGFTMVFFLVLCFASRQLNKWRVLKGRSGSQGKSLLLVTSSSLAPRAMEALSESEGYKGYFVSGIMLLDYSSADLPDYNLPVLPFNRNSVLKVSRAWVDEALILQPDDALFPAEFINDLMETGITVNYAPIAMADGRWPITDVREICGLKVLTASTNMVTAGQAAMKRVADIVGGLIGCLLTMVLFVFIAPIIYAKSPGPIFFAQERVGRNGRTFKMYKFRSMYLDAEERKAELSEQNKIGDGMMFKMEGDPRIIDGHKRRRDGSPGGFGNFIRQTSLDEFPQFFNVLKGDMSLVGTRPPTMDEWARYSTWHRSRLSVKPGITGLWQVSGRSAITDFDEVVRLDRQYIDEWSPLLDLKILVKTVAVVFKRSGAE